MLLRWPRFACLVLLLTAPSLCPALRAQKIQDPHASFLDISTRRALLQSTTDPLLRDAIAHLPSCTALPPVAPPHGVMFIPKHYLEDSHGPTNPAEAAATRVYGEFEIRIAAGMNRWVATGSEIEAKCALDQLDQWAQAKALLNYTRDQSPQAWYQVEWTLSAAGMTDSVLVNDRALDPTEQHRITAWLDTAVKQDISFEKPNDTQNNHHYWRALAATAVGIPANDDKLFRFGVSTYKDAIAEIDRNGAFPKEMARHERAIHYQSFALDPLILIATFASRQGVDLFTYSAHGRTLRDAVVFLGRALDDPSIVNSYTSDEQLLDLGQGSFDSVTFYAARFGAAGLPASLVKGIGQPATSPFLAGSATVLAATAH